MKPHSVTRSKSLPAAAARSVFLVYGKLEADTPEARQRFNELAGRAAEELNKSQGASRKRSLAASNSVAQTRK